ncbi:(2Fe-2S)-binding protein [Clostridium cylindrosporum]|uniref:Glyceraldehyde dehydrogenase small chain CutC n=1 Tax=Clostridium cylindrosporum DSM 605 TaxID=1121307 RepID=A0A0J8DD11_CLOCY|nr:(2Fe-2S)-binding protein [Clostridium cylindrosporum]KMT22144.1 glyceraldehyde dehydrogenase small chain CutC [Clostridium cylindrosporum DSM 605]
MFDLKINVNGVYYEKQIKPDTRLLDFIRNNLGLTGTKEGCGEGECGACTVIVNGIAVDSCLMLAMQCHEKNVETIEGLERDGVLHPVQKAFLDNGAVQCGFCIPGMVLSAKALLDSNKDPSEEEIKECISGNLCRCTGYDKMFKAIKSAKESYSGKDEI